MKARLVARNDNLFLLKSNGAIDPVFMVDARNFLLNFEDSQYLLVEGSWCHDSFTIDNFSGKTVAYLSDDGDLVIKDVDTFRKIIVEGDVDYLTVKEFADLHGKGESTIRRLCNLGKIPGVIQRGKSYFIPANATLPETCR